MAESDLRETILRVAPADAEPAPDPAPAAGPSRLALVGRVFWPVACLFQLGLLVGWWSLHGVGGPQPAEPVETPAPALPPRVEGPEPPGAGDRLARADNLALDGKHEAALALYAELRAAPGGEVRPDLRQRTGACEEALGRWDAALASYRAAASRLADPAPAAAAQVAQARVWLRVGRPAEACELLWHLLLQSGRPELQEDGATADARYLLALALSHTAWSPGQVEAGREPPLVHAPLDGPPRPALLPPGRPPGPTRQPAAAGAPGDGVVVRQAGPSPVEALVRVSVPQLPVAELIDRIARQCQVGVQWSPDARRRANGRSAAMQVEGLSAGDVLRSLAGPLELVCTAQGAEVTLTTEAETSPAALAALRVADAERALRDAILRQPKHPLAPAACLELGNLAASAGRPEEAVAWYERLGREHAGSPATTVACYNAGQVHRARGDFAAARSALYLLVDRAPAHELAGPAYLTVGRLYFEEGDAARAVPALRRALAITAGSPLEGSSAVLLAAAYVAADNPGAAGAVLLDRREPVNQEPVRRAAAFVSAYARYLAATSRRQREGLEGELLAALLAAQEDRVLGLGGRLLMGRAYRALGLGEQMAAAYARALPAARGEVAAEMAFARAEHLDSVGRRAEAVPLYTSVAALQGSRLAAAAALRLAETALQEGKADECLARCRKLLAVAAAAEAPAALGLMGRAYERQGDHVRAARCFAGQAPP